ncbi:NAD(P)-binding domain-containing protein, partial [Komagataeibacter europaeus]
MQIGIVGLGKMGGNIAIRLTRHGHDVVLYDRTPAVMTKIGEQAVAGKTIAASGLKDMVSRLTAERRIIWLMLPAGPVTEAAVQELGGLLGKGDILIDGGNSFYKDDIRRAAELMKKGIHYIDVGTSGGVWGLERGYCMMYGGTRDATDHIDPILSALAPGIGDIPRTPNRDKPGFDPRAEQGYLHCGPAGS